MPSVSTRPLCFHCDSRSKKHFKKEKISLMSARTRPVLIPNACKHLQRRKKVSIFQADLISARFRHRSCYRINVTNDLRLHLLSKTTNPGNMKEITFVNGSMLRITAAHGVDQLFQRSSRRSAPTNALQMFRFFKFRIGASSTILFTFHVTQAHSKGRKIMRKSPLHQTEQRKLDKCDCYLYFTGKNSSTFITATMANANSMCKQKKKKNQLQKEISLYRIVFGRRRTLHEPSEQLERGGSTQLNTRTMVKKKKTKRTHAQKK